MFLPLTVVCHSSIIVTLRLTVHLCYSLYGRWWLSQYVILQHLKATARIFFTLLLLFIIVTLYHGSMRLSTAWIFLILALAIFSVRLSSYFCILLILIALATG